MKYVLMILTLIAGGMLPFQAIINTRLGKQTGGPLMGALLSFAVGLICLLVLNFIVNNQALTNLRPAKVSPYYLWLGGVLGAIFVGYITYVNQQLGVVLTFVLVVSGQVIVAMTIDHFGWLGSAVKLITWQKLAGVALLAAGIFLIKK